MHDKFQQLKHLVICLGQSTMFCAGYDFLSLASFVDACPALETFILRVNPQSQLSTLYVENPIFYGQNCKIKKNHKTIVFMFYDLNVL
jgi:hypothetical protein